LWTELLGVAVTDVNTDFFDLGGHSLLAARLIFEIQRAWGSALSLGTFLDSGRTVAKLAALLGTPRSDGGGDAESSRPPMYFVYPDIACAMSLRHFAAQWGPRQPVYPLILEQPSEPFDRSLEVQRLASQLLGKLRERQPHGPYVLAGYSLGAIVAYELAGQLVEAGEAVNWLGIFDTAAPSLAKLLATPWARLRRLQNLPAAKRWPVYGQVALRILRRSLSARQLTKQYEAGIARDITCRYDRAGHVVPVHLFVAEGSAAQVDAHQLGWDDFHAGPLTVFRFPGSHEALLDQPSVVEVARCALESLRDTQAIAP
jgi:thioesterase domain-containing protein